MRIVVDTNVLIDGFSDPYSYPARLLDSVLAGKITALITPAVASEYRKIVQRLINDESYQDYIETFMKIAEPVQPQAVPLQLDDEDDVKFLAAAIGGSADFIVTSDRHLLDAGEAEGIPIVTPTEAWQKFNDAMGGSSEWQEWAQNLGIR